MKPVVWVAEIGSIPARSFAWCRKDEQTEETGDDIAELTTRLAQDITASLPVALGFECPLFIPIAADPIALTKARPGEGNRAWSAQAGAMVLVTGLAECVWIFEQIRTSAKKTVLPALVWAKFTEGSANLFIWEALVTGKNKGPSHRDDALIAAKSFWENLAVIDTITAVTASNPYSLVAAALLRARVSTDVNLLFEPCIVITAPAPTPDRAREA